VVLPQLHADAGELEELAAEHDRLAGRLGRLEAEVADERTRAAVLSEIAEALRESGRLRLRVCAWCGRVSVGARWHRPQADELPRRLRTPAATHGICPDCFAELAPGTSYPG
jgi:hypothetical protein